MISSVYFGMSTYLIPNQEYQISYNGSETNNISSSIM